MLLVDDHPIVREGLARVIDQEADFTVCATAVNAQEAVRAVTSAKPDIAVVDVSLDGAHGIDLVKDLKNRHPDLAVVMLSMHDETLYAERALRAGARGYVMKQEATRRITTALRRIREGHIYVSEHLGSTLLGRLVDAPAERQASPVDALSDRELEVLRLIGQGYKTGEIAHALKRSVNTVDTHRANIKRKLNLKSGAELARLAFQFAGEGSGSPQ